uniref:Uncharacterized protein n=1 Tax=Zea mays TaxID=4577 RepID=C0P8U3_MAIZE|nr:unknown [Zea mays]
MSTKTNRKETKQNKKKRERRFPASAAPTVQPPPPSPSRGRGGRALQEHRLLRVDDDVAQRVGDLAAAGVLHELGRREEAAVADAHDPHLLPLPVLVQEPVRLAPAGALRLVRHHGHVLRHGAPEVARARRPHRQRPQRAQAQRQRLRLVVAGRAVRSGRLRRTAVRGPLLRPAGRRRPRRRQGDRTAELEAAGHGVLEAVVAATGRRNRPSRAHGVAALEALALGLEAPLALHRAAAEPVLHVLRGQGGGAEQVRRRRGGGAWAGVLRPAAGAGGGSRQGADRRDGGRALEPRVGAPPLLRRLGAEAAAEGQAEAELDLVRLPAGPRGRRQRHPQALALHPGRTLPGNP